jgi:hypothetical protein
MFSQAKIAKKSAFIAKKYYHIYIMCTANYGFVVKIRYDSMFNCPLNHKKFNTVYKNILN